MQPREVEIWALRILDEVASNRPFETSLVELKTQWPDAPAAARRIAGHANSARGNPILWLIGVDEKAGIKGATPNDMARWWSEVRACFDHNAPECVDVVVNWNGASVVALCFLTDLAPYVVKNPAFGKPGGGPVRLEVPWRTATAVDSANRSQLLLLLAPSPKIPEFNILESQLAITRSNLGGVNRVEWNLSFLIYVTPRTPDRIALAAHRMRATHEIPGQSSTDYEGEIVMFPMGWRDGAFTPFVREPSVHPTIRGTNFDLTIDGPGLIQVIATTPAAEIGPVAGNRIARLKLAPTGCDLGVELSITLHHNPRADWPERWTSP